MGQHISVAGADLGLWRQDVTSDRSTAHTGRASTVGGGGYCAADIKVSKEVNVERNETRVAPGKAVVCQITNTKVNSTFHPSAAGKSSTGLSGCG